MTTDQTLADEHAAAARYVLLTLHDLPRGAVAVRLAHLPDLSPSSPCMAEGGPDAPN